MTDYTILNGSDPSQTINDAVFTATSTAGSGVGGMNAAILVIQNSGTEEGVSTDGTFTMDEKESSHTNVITLANLAVQNVGGTDYYVFRLDLAESGNATNPEARIDLTKLQLFGSADKTLNTLAEVQGGNPIYDLGSNVVHLSDWNAGSGQSDYQVLIPKSSFDGKGEYVYLYSQFTHANSAPEEWGALMNTPVAPSNPDFTVTKTADQSNIDSASDDLTYTIAVQNTGDTAIHASVSDPGYVLGDPSGDDGNGVLDVGETWTYTVTRDVTQSDMDHGDALTNTVTVSTTEAGSKSASASTTITQNADIDVIKTLSTGTGDGAAVNIDSDNSVHVLAGAALHWNFQVINQGNITLKVDASDSKDNATGQDVIGGTANIAVGGSATYGLNDVAAAGAHSDVVTAHGVGLYTAAHDTATDTGGYTGVTAGIDIQKYISTDGLTWSDHVFTMANQTLYYKVNVTDQASDTGLTDTITSLTDPQHSITGVLSTLGYLQSDDSDIYTLLSGNNGGSNTASLTASVSDAYGNSTTLNDSDTVSYTTMVGGLSKGYWANHESQWSSKAGTNLVIGDVGAGHAAGNGAADESNDISFAHSGALLMMNSSATGDARIIMAGQAAAAELNAYQAGVTANGLLEQAAKWFTTFGEQDANAAKDTTMTDNNTGHTCGPSQVTVAGNGGANSDSEWVNDKKNGFSFQEGSSVSTNSGAWTGNFIHDGVWNVTGEGLKNILMAYDHGVSGTNDGIVVSTDGAWVGWQHNNVISHVYANTSFDNVVAVVNDANAAGQELAQAGVHLAGISHA